MSVLGRTEKVLTWAITILFVASALANIRQMQEPTRTIMLRITFFLGIGLAFALLWNALVVLRLRESFKVLRGARAIGVTNIQPDRIKTSSLIMEKLRAPKRIRIFGVSGSSTIEDFGDELREALYTQSCSIQVIFSTEDDYIESKDLKPIVVRSCMKLQDHLREAKKLAEEHNRRVGNVQIAFFKSHNNLPQILCDDTYGAFHIAVSRGKSKRTPFFELSGQITADGHSLLEDFIKNFDSNWEYLKKRGLVGSVDNHEELFGKGLSGKTGTLDNQQQAMTERARKNFNEKLDDRNYKMAEADSLINHHFGIGTVNNIEGLSDQTAIQAELHRLELHQIDILMQIMEPLGPTDKVIDLGCGRGGTAFSINLKYGCKVVGVNISESQVEKAEEIAKSKHAQGVSFRVMDFHNLDFPGERFTHAVLNESTMYSVDLDALIEGVAKVLSPGGRLVIAAWCMSGDYSREVWAERINGHYGTEMHTTRDYESALERHFKAVHVNDYSSQAIDYFKLRRKWDKRSEIEDCYLEGFTTGKMQYLYATATKSD